MEEMFETLPQHTCSWSKGQTTLYKYQGFWNLKDFHEKVILAQQSFKARPTDVFLCSYPKSGTTWLKALGFAIVTREKYNESTSPLLTKMPHECTLYLEQDLEKILQSRNNSHSIPLVSTHLPYACLPESVIASNCKIVYIYRNIKDVIVSYYHFLRNILQLSVEDAPFNEACEEFCQGISIFGSYWDHILGYRKAIQERPERFLLLKYEDMKRGAPSEVKKLAEFIGYPFTIEEERAGVIENIVKLCSFENLSNFQVNKNGMQQPGEDSEVENRLFFRKGEVGDWENYFTDEWKEKIDRMIDQKLNGTDLVLK